MMRHFLEASPRERGQAPLELSVTHDSLSRRRLQDVRSLWPEFARDRAANAVTVVAPPSSFSFREIRSGLRPRCFERKRPLTGKTRTLQARLLGAVLLAAVTLGACATATPYQVMLPGRSSEGGFSEQRIEANRFRVTFAGNSLTSREAVNRYLLYRAAELTTLQGYDWFRVTDRRTDRKANSYLQTHPFYSSWYGSDFGHLGPNRRLLARGQSLNAWGPRFGRPAFGAPVEIRTIEKFEATAEIFMGRGVKSVEDPTAFEARSVIENLEPTLLRPAGHER